MYQQLAVGLYVLGGVGTTGLRVRVTLNIGEGTIWLYLWQLIFFNFFKSVLACRGDAETRGYVESYGTRIG